MAFRWCSRSSISGFMPGKVRRAVVPARSCAVEQLVVLGDKRLPSVSIFPQPVAEGALDDLLLLLGEGGLLDVEHPALVPSASSILS